MFANKTVSGVVPAGNSENVKYLQSDLFQPYSLTSNESKKAISPVNLTLEKKEQKFIQAVPNNVK
jgi:hypothetical protein